jgi:hypothetical protein
VRHQSANSRLRQPDTSWTTSLEVDPIRSISSIRYEEPENETGKGTSALDADAIS